MARRSVGDAAKRGAEVGARVGAAVGFGSGLNSHRSGGNRRDILSHTTFGSVKGAAIGAAVGAGHAAYKNHHEEHGVVTGKQETGFHASRHGHTQGGMTS